MKNKIYFVLIFLVLFAVLGYIREFYFVHLNIIMSSIYYQKDPVRPIPGIMSVLNNFSYEFLYYFKYVCTIVFVFIFFLLNRLAIKKLTLNSLLPKLVFYAYILMLVVALISMTYGYFFNDRLQDDEYTLSRWLMGVAQSPIICLILLASEKLFQKTTTP